MEAYYLLLVPLDEYSSDPFGNVYSSTGFVKAKKFTKDKDLRFGLSGYLWGKGVSGDLNPNSYTWVVVRADHSSHLIAGPDTVSSLTKFESGVIMARGTINDCNQYILTSQKTNQYPDFKHIHKFNVAGTIMRDKTHSVFTDGFAHKVNVRGYKNHCITCGSQCVSETTGDETNAVVFGEKSKAHAQGDWAASFASGKESESEISGDESVAVSLGSDSRSVSRGINSVAMAFGYGGMASASEGGTIVLAYSDSKGRKRFKVGYVGEDLKSDILYTLNEKGEFVEAPDLSELTI